MNRTRLILLTVALVTAFVAAYLSTVILSRPPAPQAPGPVVIQNNDTVDVLVAARNLAQGELLGGFSLEWRSWPKNGITPQMITKESMPDALDQMQQARAKLPIVAGELIVSAKIVRPGDRSFMSAILPQGMRAVAVPIGETTSVSGFVLPNDRVDVLLARQLTDPASGEKVSYSETVLNNVKVLAINQSMSAGDDEAAIPAGRTAVLELDPLQTEIVTGLIPSGTLTLVLRSLAEGGSEGMADDRPTISDSFLTPRNASGTLVIRYGVERTVPSR